jgi:hypothetical protein
VSADFSLTVDSQEVLFTGTHLSMGKDTTQALDYEDATLTKWVEKVGKQYVRSGSL